MANAIGWIVWGVLVLLAISWTFGIFHYLKTRGVVTKATILQTASFWIIAAAFLITGWNKLHLIWLVPLVFFTEMIMAPSLFGGIPLKDSISGFKEVLGSKKNGEIRAKIRQLTKEVEGENREIDFLLDKYKDNPDVLSGLPEFTDPATVVPQVCRRQLLFYLHAKAEGLSEKECLRAVLTSRYGGPVNLTGLKTADFEEFLNAGNVRLPDLCKEILNKEQGLEDDSIKRFLTYRLVDEYFAEIKEQK